MAPHGYGERPEHEPQLGMLDWERFDWLAFSVGVMIGVLAGMIITVLAVLYTTVHP